MRNILLFIFFSFTCMQSFAVPAFHRVITITDGHCEKKIVMRGDENGKFAITEDGYTCVREKDAWVYVSRQYDGTLKSSNLKVLPSNENMSLVSKFFEENKPYEGEVMDKVFSNSKTAATPLGSLVAKANIPIVGTRKILIVLVEFPDCKFTKSLQDFDDLFNKEGYCEDGAQGSVYDYYKRVSLGQLNLKSTILGIYTTKHEMSYYGANFREGGNDVNVFGLFLETLEYVKSNIDIEDYDANSDGFIDNIHIIYAGHGEEAGASSDAIWAHESTFMPISIGNKSVDRYSCSPELRGATGDGITRIGPPCHEIGHALGAMDYYDTDYSTDGNYEGTGKWDVMASGSWNNEGISPADFNPYVKTHDFKWIEATLLDENHYNVTCSENDIYRINTQTSDEYFLLQYANSEYISGNKSRHGLKIFHIGPDIEKLAAKNKINSSYPQQCYIVDASSAYRCPTNSPQSYGTTNSEGCLFPGNSINCEFTHYSIPNTAMINGKLPDFGIYDIREGNNHVSFRYQSVDKEKETIWAEDFEAMFISGDWENKRIQGSASWQKKMFFEEPSNTDIPVAYKGIGAIGLDNNSSNSDIYIAELTRSVSHPSDKNQLYSINFHTWFSKSRHGNDSICVLLRNKKSNIERTIYIFKNNGSKKWQNHEAVFYPDEDYYIVFRGYVSSETKLLLDDITVSADIIGDIDGDGQVTFADAEIVTESYISSTPKFYNKEKADINRDGEVSLSDANAIVNILLGK